MKPALPDNDLLFVIVTSVYNVYILGLETLFSVYICFFGQFCTVLAKTKTRIVPIMRYYTTCSVFVRSLRSRISGKEENELNYLCTSFLRGLNIW